MRLLEEFGEWSESTRRNMEEFQAALLTHLQRVSDYPISWEAVRQGIRTPPPLPHSVFSAPYEDGSWSADTVSAQRKF